MELLANFKAKRAAKRAARIFEEDMRSWNSEQEILNIALDIFTGAAGGVEPEDHQLVQKKGELVLWTGQAILQEAGRTPSTYSGGSSGISVPVVAGIRVRVGSFKGSVIPGEEIQIEKDSGLVKLTNQRLIFSGPYNTMEWAFAKMLSAARNESGNSFIIGVSNRKKTSGLVFSPSDGPIFARLFAMALYSFEEGVPATVKAIKEEIKQSAERKPVLLIESAPKQIKA